MNKIPFIDTEHSSRQDIIGTNTSHVFCIMTKNKALKQKRCVQLKCVKKLNLHAVKYTYCIRHLLYSLLCKVDESP